MAVESNLILTVDLRSDRDIVMVRQHAREIAAHAGFDQLEQTRISTAASEIARNAFKYGGGGHIEFKIDSAGPRERLLMTILDHGPGIADLPAILEGSYRSKTGLGKGILGAKKLMDDFEIRTAPGHGTTVVLGKFLPPGSPAVTTRAVTQIAEEIRKSVPRDPFAEVQHQNQELLRMLQEVQSREAELARLHAILRRESDEAIHTREAQLQGIISSAMDAIVSLDEQGRIIVFNAAAEKMFRCPEQDVLQTAFDRFTTAAFREHYNESVRTLESSGDSACPLCSPRGLTAKRLTGEEFPVEATVSRVTVAGQKLFTLILRDITERRRAELLEEQLRQAQKMEAIGRLAGGVAHDFNTLLNIMLGYSELLLAELPQGDSRRERAEQIEKSAQTGALLTKQLLAFSRKQPIAPQVIDLNGMVRDLEPMLRRLLRSDITLEAHYSSDICPVKVDAGQMQQVVLNLASNARDAMPNGGSLMIEVKPLELDASYARQHPGLMPGKYIMLAVSDNGTGMDSETVSHIFEPFFTTKGQGKGTGLGLATVNGIVKQNGGDIAVYSELGVGSIFKLHLPCSNEQLAEEVVSKTPEKLSGDETILLVEDSPGLRSLTRELLSRQGYSVLEAPDGVEALELSRTYEGTIHLMITDIVMPRMRGTELATQIAEQRPETSVLFLSGYTEDAIWRLRDNHRFAILEKPYSSVALLRTVRQKLDEASRTTA
jgi:two-component system, cell cycle sensor histidine kinase and response regulator CckA